MMEAIMGEGSEGRTDNRGRQETREEEEKS